MHIEVHEPASGVIEQIRQVLGCPRLWFHLSELGRSESEFHRRDLRRALIEFLTQKIKSRELGPFEDLPHAISELVKISDPQKLPELSYAQISISHCPQLGGFAVNPGTNRVGFDIEVEGRVSEAVAARIGSPNEVEAAPDPTSLWVAKESAFKAMHRHVLEPTTISEIEIFNWQRIEPHLLSFSFTVRNIGEEVFVGRGSVLHFRRLKLGFSTPKS